MSLLAACQSREAPAPAPHAMVEQGRVLLAQYQCGRCHAIPGVPAARSPVGPNLAAYGLRSYIAGNVPHDAATLTRWIMEPAALIPDTPMPSLGVPPAEARAMAAYLRSLR